jgi:hypothetical protein
VTPPRIDADGRARHRPTGSGSTGLSALPSRLARALAFASILAGGACGGLIGYGVVKVTAKGDKSTAEAIGAVVGALIIAGGVAVNDVLVLRAMGEWRSQDQLERRAPRGGDRR